MKIIHVAVGWTSLVLVDAKEIPLLNDIKTIKTNSSFITKALNCGRPEN